MDPSSSRSGIRQPSAEVQDRFDSARREYEDYLALTERVQVDLKEDAGGLRAQEGWDEETWLGVEEWVDDKDSIWRALRRNGYDEAKTLTYLLSILAQRLKLSLHSSIPAIEPYSNSSLFHILPLPRYHDLLDRPIAELTMKRVIREEDGNLEDLKQWIWWCLELLRRTLRDYWVKGVFDDRPGKKRKGKGGEGCVVLVNAEGASYRNMEAELLPTLLSVAHSNFPGLIEAVYIVNAGWTHRSMWNIVKRVLPKSVLEKVNFLDNKQSLEGIFDLTILPKTYGGEDQYIFDPSNNPFQHYFRKPSFGTSLISHNAHSNPPSRNISTTSIADVYYTARNTPVSSRRNSISNGNGSTGQIYDNGNGFAGRLGSRLTMTRPRELPMSSPEVKVENDGGNENDRSIAPSVDVTGATPSPNSNQSLLEDTLVKSQSKSTSATTSRTPSATSAHQTPLQRIKSLSDFHLYLSPSRLANIDLLSDSDPDIDSEPEIPSTQLAVPRPRHASVKFDKHTNASLHERRERPPLALNGLSRTDAERTYSGRLQQHHAKALEHYAGPGPSNLTTDNGVEESEAVDEGVAGESDEEEVTPQSQQPPSNVAAYSSSNPWFGYPVIAVPDPTRIGGTSLRPRYTRNRKRDLVKTLLFLFMLKLQNWRDGLERALGLNRLRSWNTSASNGVKTPTSINWKSSSGTGPTEGLLRNFSGGDERKLIQRQRWDKDWWWMIIGFLLLRGTWSRIVLAPMEAVLQAIGGGGGREGWKVVLGLS